MTFPEIMSVVFGGVGVLIALAALKTEQRAWLKKLSGKVALVAFTLIAVANSVFGIYSFVVKAAPPTREEIVFLLLQAFNLVQIPSLAFESWSGAKVRVSQERLIKAYASAQKSLENKV